MVYLKNFHLQFISKVEPRLGKPISATTVSKRCQGIFSGALYLNRENKTDCKENNVCNAQLFLAFLSVQEEEYSKNVLKIQKDWKYFIPGQLI